MKQTEQTLLEQMRITEFEIEHRKALFGFSQVDVKALLACKPIIELCIDTLVTEFYRLQTNIAEIALLIGDADTLGRLRNAQRSYILSLFSGLYGVEYVNHRLRIGLVHKRIGVEPKLYLSAIHSLSDLLQETIKTSVKNDTDKLAALNALSKLLLFDVSLVFDTYIRSLVAEIENAKDKSEQYARSMEEKVKERTLQLEELSRTDPLTGLLNVRYFNEIITHALRSAQRRAEPVSAVYLDINDFKKINDEKGHQYGDVVLREVGQIIAQIVRSEDYCFRYGGDEFCVIMCNCNSTQAQEVFVTRFNELACERLPGLIVSIGVAHTGPNAYVEANELIRQADQHMYDMKNDIKSHDMEP